MTTEQDPAVSVVIATRNRADVLPRAIRSVLAQTCDDFELVVVDDGSTDRTEEVRDSIMDPRVVWIEGPATGVSRARNAGLARARGEWVAFLDDDNEWMPEYLDRQLAAAAASGAEVVCCAAIEVERDGPRRSHDPTLEPDPALAFTRGWCPFTSSVVARRSAVLDAGGFPPHLSHSEDRFLWLRLALDRRWSYTPDALMLRHSGAGHRLSENHAAISAADAEIERTYGRELRRRVGLVPAMRFFWFYRGRNEIRGVIQHRGPGGRRAAWRALVVLASALPRSASSVWRPAVVLLLGTNTYRTSRDLYHLVHSCLIGRRRS